MTLIISSSIDVVIPCFNAEATLAQAVHSALVQRAARYVWVSDDGSTDDSLSLAESLRSVAPERIRVIRSEANRGAAAARNAAINRSDADYIACLDADDTYERQALDPALAALRDMPEFAMIRLALKPVGVPEVYAKHPRFAEAWRRMELTVAGNMVIRRTVLMAAGGFPTDEIFRRFGGEDGALGEAVAGCCHVGTLFDQAGVRYAYRSGAHAERLLRAVLFDEMQTDVGQSLAAARALRIALRERLIAAGVGAVGGGGIRPIIVGWGEGE